MSLVRKVTYMNDVAYKTAIARSKISVPMRYLKARGKLTGRVLDYGCGKGFDADTLGLTGFDPHYRPKRPIGRFDTITCNYVFNVVTNCEVSFILNDIKSLLKSGGIAYVAVRRDVKKEGYTSKGTYQVNRVLSLPVEYEKKGSFIIYRLVFGVIYKR